MKNVRLMRLLASLWLILPTVALAQSTEKGPLFRMRVCDRVQQFGGNEKMFARMNERVSKRFGFDCRTSWQKEEEREKSINEEELKLITEILVEDSKILLNEEIAKLNAALDSADTEKERHDIESKIQILKEHLKTHNVSILSATYRNANGFGRDVVDFNACRDRERALKLLQMHLSLQSEGKLTAKIFNQSKNREIRIKCKR